MKRDVVLHLFHVMERWMQMRSAVVDRNIRIVIGTNGGHLVWKNHPYFIKIRIEFSNIPVIFQPNPHGGYTILNTAVGQRCVFEAGSYYHRTVFLANPLNEGVFCLAFTFYCPLSAKLAVGAASASYAGRCGTWSMLIEKDRDRRFFTSYHTGSNKDIRRTHPEIPDSVIHDYSCLAIEIDTVAHKLYFLVDNVRQPTAFECVCGPVHFGISGSNKASWTTKSFRRLYRTTPSTIEPTYY